jgi:hypothetical protein
MQVNQAHGDRGCIKGPSGQVQVLLNMGGNGLFRSKPLFDDKEQHLQSSRAHNDVNQDVSAGWHERRNSFSTVPGEKGSTRKRRKQKTHPLQKDGLRKNRESALRRGTYRIIFRQPGDPR